MGGWFISEPEGLADISLLATNNLYILLLKSVVSSGGEQERTGQRQQQTAADTQKMEDRRRKWRAVRCTGVTDVKRGVLLAPKSIFGQLFSAHLVQKRYDRERQGKGNLLDHWADTCSVPCSLDGHLGTTKMTRSTTIITRRRLPCVLSCSLLLLACLALFPTQPVDGFAAWLAEGAHCYTDLQPPEIIMNAAVVPHGQSTHKGVQLEVYSAEGKIMEPTRINNEMYYEQEGPRTEYVLKLYIPPKDLKSGALGDLQYVVDVSPSSPATFRGPNTGCDRRRSHGRQKDDAGVRLRVDFDGEAADEVDAADEVVVWAGWATGHEAVQLTEAVVFRRQKRKDNNKDKKKDTVEAAEDAGRARAAAALIEDYEGGGKSKSSNNANYAQERLDEMRRAVHHVDGGHDHKRVVDDQIGGGQKKKTKNNDGDDDDGGDGGGRPATATAGKKKAQAQKHDKKKNAKPYVPSGPRPTGKEQDETNFGAFRRKYHKHELGMQQFSMGGYLAGCALLATMGLTLARYSELAGRRLHKGSRTL